MDKNRFTNLFDELKTTQSEDSLKNTPKNTD